MYIPAFVLLIASLLFFGAVLLVRARGELLNRERTASWISSAIGAQEQ
jgi:hypothetical protein